MNAPLIGVVEANLPKYKEICLIFTDENVWYDYLLYFGIIEILATNCVNCHAYQTFKIRNEQNPPYASTYELIWVFAELCS